MNKYFIGIFIFLNVVSNGFSQKSVNDFQFVSVPEYYEFLHERDQYQLNTYTKFLLNKYGFNAFFESELPNVRRCDGLYATLEGSPGFVYTKLTVVLKDCEGNEIFRGETGKSKEKEFKRAYHEALREAFESVERLYANQKDVKVTLKDDVSEAKEVNVQQMSDSDEKNEENSVSFGTGVKMNNEVKTNNTYLNNDTTFSLSKNPEGYSLWELGSTKKLKGNLIENKEGSFQFVDTSGNTFPGYFDKD